MATSQLGYIEGPKEMRAMVGPWLFDEDDFCLIAQLQDPVMCAELLFSDPLNHAYSGCYKVRDYQYPLFRSNSNYEIYPCSRDVGKTESIKAKSICHAFKRMGEDLFITAPELIHLESLTPFIEQRIRETRLTRDFLVHDNQRTGVTHKPFTVDFADGTRIVARIPKITGVGMKGMHAPDLLMDESQDFPEAGWVESFPTVLKEHVDKQGKPDFSMQHYGVHQAGKGGTFARLATSPSYHTVQITQLMKEGWNKETKRAAAAMYGGSNTPDYRRNILGEPGTSWSQFFVTARLMACVDQNADSKYNQMFMHQEIQAEELPRLVSADGDVGELLDLPDRLGQQVYVGMDVGLVTDPTVIMIWAILPDEHKRNRLTLMRMIHAWRLTEGQIRKLTYRIARQYGLTLRAFGQDITGLGLPLYQAMEGDEKCPNHLKDVAQGYVFNAKVPVSVDPNYVSEQGHKLEDQYGHMVEVVRDKWTGQESLVAYMSMIEASTRYLRGFVDEGFMRLPFHPDLVKDFQGESEQRVKAMAGVKKKPNAFHMLDAARAMAMAYRQGEVDEQVYARSGGGPVMDKALFIGGGAPGGGMGLR
jgi:hypothetical protein